MSSGNRQLHCGQGTPKPMPSLSAEKVHPNGHEQRWYSSMTQSPMFSILLFDFHSCAKRKTASKHGYVETRSLGRDDGRSGYSWSTNCCWSFQVGIILGSTTLNKKAFLQSSSSSEPWELGCSSRSDPTILGVTTAPPEFSDYFVFTATWFPLA